jgi:tungstate transport system ATP-binding protein
MNNAKSAPGLISLQNVSHSHGRVQALHDLNFSIAQGESVALVGANGSGKSTLLRLMQSLLIPTLGSVYQADLKRQAFVFQKPWMLRASVLTNVALAAWLRGKPWAHAKQDAFLALQKVDLADLAHRAARTLSGGQQQRLAVARACVSQPSLLLMDEPTASLSPPSKREMEQLMALFKNQGMTLVFASHNLGQVKRLASRVVALDQGRVVFDGSAQDFFETPQSALSQRTAAQILEGEYE